jgi:hypothetical protein
MDRGDRVEALIRRRFRNCVTGSLFELRQPRPTWFGAPTTGRQLHLVELVRTRDAVALRSQ